LAQQGAINWRLSAQFCKFARTIFNFRTEKSEVGIATSGCIAAKLEKFSKHSRNFEKFSYEMIEFGVDFSNFGAQTGCVNAIGKEP